MADCQRCEAPIPDVGYLCAPCTNKLTITLLYAAMHAHELPTTISRTDRIGHSVSPHRPPTPNDPWQHGKLALTAHPLPVNLDAAAAAERARTVAWRWVTYVTIGRQVSAPVRGLSGALTWLATHARWLRTTGNAGTAYEDLTEVARLIRRTVDTAPPRALVGQCECGVHLYGVRGQPAVTCHGCGTVYDVEHARAILRARAHDMLFTAAELATLAVHLGLSTDRLRTRKLINQMSKRGLLLPHGDIDGSPSYRCGEALAKLAERITRA